jgi:hypothetical protein
MADIEICLSNCFNKLGKKPGIPGFFYLFGNERGTVSAKEQYKAIILLLHISNSWVIHQSSRLLP